MKLKTSQSQLTFVIIALMLIVLGGAWLLTHRNDSGLAGGLNHTTLKSDGYAYGVDFSKDAKQEKIVDRPYLVGHTDNQVEVRFGAQPVPWPVISDCGIIGPGWQAAFKVNRSGKSYQVCRQHQVNYLTVFEDRGQKHMISIDSSDTKKPLKDETVREILSSVTVSKS